MGRRAHLPDADPDETGEWLEALRDVAGRSGASRARILLHEILGEAYDLGISNLASFKDSVPEYYT